MKNARAAGIVVSMAAVFIMAGGAMAQETWDGDGDDQASLNWSVPENWTNDTLPGAGGAILPTVNAGTVIRTVTVDTAQTIRDIVFVQDNDTGINKLSLGANLTLNRAAANATVPVWTTTLSGGATNANIVADLNGHRIIISAPQSSTANGFALRGTLNFNQDGSAISIPTTGHVAMNIFGVVNVTANGSMMRNNAGTGDTQFSFASGSNVTITGSTLSISDSAAGSGAARGMKLTNNGSLSIASNAALSVRSVSNGTTAERSAVITNAAAGVLTQAGRIEMKANANATANISMTNNGTWTVSGSNAIIYRLDSGFIHVPTFTNAATRILKGSSASDTLEFDEQTADGSRRMTITNNGTIAPGAGSSGAALATVGNLILRDINVSAAAGGGGKIDLDIGGAAAGEHDKLSLLPGLTDAAGAGTFDLTTGNTLLQLNSVNGFDYTSPFSPITLVEAGSVAGMFTSIKIDANTFTGNTYDLGDGKELAVTYTGTAVVLSHIPEPGTAVLALGGLVVMLLRRRVRG